MSDRIGRRREADGAAPRAEPSKTERKKQMHALQTLGEALAALPPDRLATIELDEGLREAIDELHRTRSHEGRRRQLQLVGKRMRGVDPEPIRAALAQFELGSAESTLVLHRIEAWRDDLIHAEDAITRWMDAHPQTDVKRLRELVRGARADAQTPPEARRGAAYRQLFQFLKPYIEGAGSS